MYFIDVAKADYGGPPNLSFISIEVKVNGHK